MSDLSLSEMELLSKNGFKIENKSRASIQLNDMTILSAQYQREGDYLEIEHAYNETSFFVTFWHQVYGDEWIPEFQEKCENIDEAIMAGLKELKKIITKLEVDDRYAKRDPSLVRFAWEHLSSDRHLKLFMGNGVVLLARNKGAINSNNLEDYEIVNSIEE